MPKMLRAAAAALLTTATVVALGAAPASAAVTLAVATGSPQDVQASSAVFRANVLVSALGGSVYWEYGTTTRYGSTTSAVRTSLVGLSEDLTAPVSGLSADTTYHVRAIASSALGTSYGRDIAFGTKGTRSSSGSGDDDTGSSGSASSSESDSSGSGKAPEVKDDKVPKPKDDKAPAPADDTPVPADSDGAAPAGDGSSATSAPGVATAEVTPILGRTLAVATVAGTVTATAPSGAPVDLRAAKTVPTGTVIDTRSGTVELTSALNRKGATQTARFWGGRFEVRQSATARGLTRLVLRGGNFTGCGAATRARTAKAQTARKKPARALWGSDDHGRFETRGRGSVATVRGTRWLTQDTCAGTRTTVAQGAVAVRDLHRRKTVLVAKGHSYLARVAP